MCYRCRLCSNVVPHNTPMRKLVLHRQVKGEKRTEIAAELPICEGCDPNKKPPIEPPKVMVSSPNGKRRVKVEKREPLCDVCGKLIGDTGKQTPESTLCAEHMKSRRRKPAR